ncbi:transmembrane protein 245 [Planococcus citri]|uniref:transmembrane protein 245 n=1 Tax=Planococcus citri TaxID=170843 RepID=UPI0031F72903
MSKTTGCTPDFREFSFKDWFGRFGSSVESQNDEKNYKQAFYNVVGTFLMVVFSAASWGVFIILQPFLKPLLWALLCGSVLYPFKNRLSKKLHSWIDVLNKPSIVHIVTDVVCFPLLIFNHITDVLGRFVCDHFYAVIALLVLSVVQFIAPQFSFSFLWTLQCLLFRSLLFVLKLCSSSVVVISIAASFTWALFFKWDIENKKILSYFSVFTWFAVLCYVASFLDLLKIPTFFALLALFIGGFVYDFMQSTETSQDEPKINADEQKQSNDQTEPEEIPVPRRTLVQRRRFTTQMSFIGIKPDTNDDTHAGDQYLYWVGCACAFVFFIKWWWTPYVVGLHIVFYFSKRLCSYIGIHNTVMDMLTVYSDFLYSLVGAEKLDVLFPAPLMSIYKVSLLCKTKVLKMLKESCDMISTITVILLVIIFIAVASVFLTMQIYTEGMYLVKVTSKVLNETLTFHQELSHMVPDNWQNQLNSAFENAYMYGRDFISKMVKKFLDGMPEDKVNELEKIVLELWDRIYQAWLVNSSDDNIVGPKVTSDAVYQIWDSLTLNIQKTPEIMNVNTLMQFVNNNMTTLSSAVKNVWEFTVDNIGLVLYLLETLLSAVFVSGFTVFSLIIDLIIFLTALFYLLNSSSDVYKPVEFLAKMSPTYGTKLALAIERSVAEVFMVSSKLSLFYGLYTWFLHNLFQMHIVYVPTVIAALLAAVPVLPTYIVCLPGVLDLWLLQENTVGAILLFLLQFAPTNLVDAAIYEDIHGGHPYLTGLGMAGGVLCFGIEGAIVGPLILCFMLVIINFCAALMRDQNNLSQSSPAIASTE